MQPVRAAPAGVPAIESVGDLADWLSLNTEELEWFADLKELGNKLQKTAVQHYHISVVPSALAGSA